MEDEDSAYAWVKWDLPPDVGICPFCGNRSSFLDMRRFAKSERPRYRFVGWIVCSYCKARGGDNGFQETSDEAQGWALALWNRRS